MNEIKDAYMKQFAAEFEKHIEKEALKPKKKSEMTTVREKRPLSDEELMILVRFVELFSGKKRDKEKAPAVTGASAKQIS